MLLIVPVQIAPSRKTLPYITFLLIIVNVLVYFTYQIDDWKRMDTVVTHYVNNGLPAKERLLFKQWVKENNIKKRNRKNNDDDDDDEEAIPPPLKKYIEESSRQKFSDRILAQNVLMQPEFDQAVQKEEGFQKDKVWQDARRTFEAERGKISFFQLGFIPARPTLSGLLAHMFLHGGPVHLLGNMIFLFIFGFALEIALGRGCYLLFYLASGIFAGAFWWVFSSSPLPGVGASGAISGLMGMYLAVYGMKRIRFFYWFLIFFGYFTAPALLMLPVWIGKELWGLLFTDANINYFAHIGGLLCGFALVMGGKALRILPLNEDYLYEKERAVPFKKALNALEKSVGELDTEKAAWQARELLTAHPQDERVLRLCYALLRSHADVALMQKFIKSILQAPLSMATEELLLKLAEERDSQANKVFLHQPQVLLDLLGRALSMQHLGMALSLWRDLQEKRQSLPDWPKLTLLLGKLAGKEKDMVVLREVSEALIRTYPRSEEAKLLYMYQQHFK